METRCTGGGRFDESAAVGSDPKFEKSEYHKTNPDFRASLRAENPIISQGYACAGGILASKKTVKKAVFFAKKRHEIDEIEG
jgi:hypothetical protein